MNDTDQIKAEEADQRLRDAAPYMLEALCEIEELVDDEIDIDRNGGPNLAMRIQTIIRDALKKAGRT